MNPKPKPPRPAISISPAVHAAVLAHCNKHGLIIKAFAEKVLTQAIKNHNKKGYHHG